MELQNERLGIFSSDPELYAARKCIYEERNVAEWCIKEGVILQREMGMLFACHDLPGVVQCIGVVVSRKPHMRVKGMLTELASKGDLFDFLR